MQTDIKNDKFLLYYLSLTYVVVLINAFRFPMSVHYNGFITYAFSAAVYMSYCFAYLLPLFLILGLLQRIITSSLPAVAFRKIHIPPMLIIYILAVLLSTFLQLFIFTDVFVFNIYGFHLNGFVWNLIITPGGIDSMGADSSTTVQFILISVGFLFVQTTLLLLLLYFERFKKFCHAVFRKGSIRTAVILLILSFIFQALTFGFSSLYGYVPVLSASGAFPLFQPITFSKLAKSFGFKPERQPMELKMKTGSFDLHYPLNPIQREPNHKKYNIVWLVAESLRWDMLDPNIMPHSWQFSQKALRFEKHYSSGNGTRMAMFGMFYGLYGNYWFNFLNENRSPVLMDLLLDDNYQIELFTSARFSYPEFDKTIFARLPQKQMHDDKETSADQGWQKDRVNVGKMIDFMKNMDPNRPFMTFLFFESPHARYYFPPENAIAKPYLEEFNYATVNLERDIKLIFNRYINSCNHLDSQIWRLIQYLEEANLLDSTIVLITGDHGEEFMEKGRWGHNSDFNDEQIRTPLVIWIPGTEARTIDHITSHLDIPATIMSVLGVTSPAADYSFGFDLTKNLSRDFTIVSSWDEITYVDSEYKAVFPMKVYNISGNKVTTSDDIEVEDDSAFYNTRQGNLVQIMKDLDFFSEN